MKAQTDTTRDFPGKRWLVNLLRALHLVGVVGLGAGVLGDIPEARWIAFGITAVVSGFIILALDGWSRPGYFREYVGMAMAGKLILLGILLAWPAQPKAS